MYKFALFVVLALAVCASANVQDQEAAEQYFQTYGTYPAWSVPVAAGLRSGAYPYGAYGAYGAYPYTGLTYPYATAAVQATPAATIKTGYTGYTYPAYGYAGYNHFY